MVSDPTLAWALTVYFTATGVCSVAGLISSRRAVDRGSYLAHLLMSVSMAIMPWTWSMAVPTVLQVVVFTLAALWFVALMVFPAHGGAGSGHHGPLALGYHAAMMISMAWMSALMTITMPGGTADHSHEAGEMPGMAMPGMAMPNMTTPVAGTAGQQPVWAVVITFGFVAMFLAATVCFLVTLVRGAGPTVGAPLPPVIQALSSLVMAVGMGASFLLMS
ncbi:DUF5134 domain-containing protein [Microbacterium horticulturae]|uniref:DUF5134 domain-containing protein n=1 Tax=Microbacterium horticulturae TaxID=3028316 RepID=A0ABY8BWX2_9MICO|nr:DUF5134 domain-containing protein [Microbacterium sp. KACC 23027]WEG08654.1 DUF5134 domain-containing protein [Microbacterium sp. KACC 23027]